MSNRSNFKELFSNTAIFAVASFSSKLVSFLLVPLYTNFLTTSEYGIIEIILNLVNLFVPVASLSISEAVLRFGLDGKSNKVSVIKNTFLILSFSSLLMFLTSPLFGFYKGIGNFCYFFSGICVLQMFRSSLSLYLKSIDKTRLFAIDSVLYSISLACLNIVFLIFFKFGVNGYFISFICAEIISILFIVIFGGVFKHFKTGRIDKELLKCMLKYSIPLIVSSLAWWIITFSDKAMIQFFIDDSSVGIYSVATRIPSLLSAVMSIFIQAWNLTSIKVYDKDDNMGGFYSVTFKYYVPLMCLIASFILLVLKPFMKIYVGQSFSDAINYVPVLLLSTCFLMISWFFNPIYNAFKRNIASTITVVIAAIFNICLNLFLIPLLGVMGAVISTLLANFVLALIRIIDTRRFFVFGIDYYRVIASLIIVTVHSIILSFNFYSFGFSIVAIWMLLAINMKEIKSAFTILINVAKKHLNKNRS